MQFHDINQNTDEWLDMRMAKLTGSACSKMMANYGKAFGDPAKKAAVQIALEQITGKRQESGYSNDHMQRGREQEPIARALYELIYFVDVDNGGFFDCGDSGCSPDGLVCDDGVIEIKSVIATTHYATIKRGGFDPAYKWQLYFNLLKTGRDWIDFVSFCAEFPAGKQLYVFRINKSESDEQFQMIIDREKQFFELVNEVKERIKQL